MPQTPHAVFGLLSIDSCKGRIGTLAVTCCRTGLGLPGGKVAPGETPEEALARRFKEKIGADITVGDALYEAEVSGALVRTYRVDLGPENPKEWATPDDLIESQSRKDLTSYNLCVLLAAGLSLSNLGDVAWIAALGSGTLQYSKAAGAAYRELYYHERCAFEVGPDWDTCTLSRLTRGKPIAMPDTPAWTEALWLARRACFAGPEALRLQQHRPEWVTITEDGEVWEGLAIVAQPKGLAWCPNDRLCVAKLARWQSGRFVA